MFARVSPEARTFMSEGLANAKALWLEHVSAIRMAWQRRRREGVRRKAEGLWRSECTPHRPCQDLECGQKGAVWSDCI